MPLPSYHQRRPAYCPTGVSAVHALSRGAGGSDSWSPRGSIGGPGAGVMNTTTPVQGGALAGDGWQADLMGTFPLVAAIPAPGQLEQYRYRGTKA